MHCDSLINAKYGLLHQSVQGNTKIPSCVKCLIMKQECVTNNNEYSHLALPCQEKTYKTINYHHHLNYPCIDIETF